MIMVQGKRMPQKVGQVRFCACGARAVAVIAVGGLWPNRADDAITFWCQAHLDELDMVTLADSLRRGALGQGLGVRSVSVRALG